MSTDAAVLVIRVEMNDAQDFDCCRVYIAAEELSKAGFDPSDPAPYYRVWGSSRGGLFVRLYREP